MTQGKVRQLNILTDLCSAKIHALKNISVFAQDNISMKLFTSLYRIKIPGDTMTYSCISENLIISTSFISLKSRCVSASDQQLGSLANIHCCAYMSRDIPRATFAVKLYSESLNRICSSHD